MRVPDVFVEPRIGLVISCERSTYVVRPMIEVEVAVHPAAHSLIACEQPTPTEPVTWMLAAHVLCQVLSVRYLRVIAPLAGDERNDFTIRRARFALYLVTRVSENDLNIALTEDLCTARAVQCAAAFAASEHTSGSIRFPGRACEKQTRGYAVHKAAALHAGYS